MTEDHGIPDSRFGGSSYDQGKNRKMTNSKRYSATKSSRRRSTSSHSVPGSNSGLSTSLEGERRGGSRRENVRSASCPPREQERPREPDSDLERITEDLRKKEGIRVEVLKILTDPLSERGRRRKGETGLRNPHNNCFLNAVIQCLSNTEPVAEYFLSQRYRSHLKVQSGTKGKIASSFAALLYSLHTQEYIHVNPERFRQIIFSVAKGFQLGRQEDAQEFLVSLLDLLHENLDQASVGTTRNVGTQESHKTGSIKETGKQSWSSSQRRSRSELRDFFQGQTVSIIQCSVCLKISNSFEQFIQLTLELPSTEKLNLNDCLEKYCAVEVLEKDALWNCPECKKPQVATKQTFLWKLPEILSIHLKRFGVDRVTGRATKRKNQVQCDISQFSLKKFMHPESEETSNNYRLYAMINHLGSLNSGHYTATCWNSDARKWLLYDDRRVTKISSAQAETDASSAYILFLKKSGAPPPK